MENYSYSCNSPELGKNSSQSTYYGLKLSISRWPFILQILTLIEESYNDIKMTSRWLKFDVIWYHFNVIVTFLVYFDILLKISISKLKMKVKFVCFSINFHATILSSFTKCFNTLLSFLYQFTFLKRTNVTGCKCNSNSMYRSNFLSWFFKIVYLGTCLKKIKK